MEYQVECEADGIAVITLTGTVTWKEAMSAGPEMLTRAMEAGCDRVLVDLSETVSEVSTMDLRDLALAVAPAKSDFVTMKRAVVVSDRILSDYTFYENVCRNQGQNMRVFRDIESARAWLLEDPRPK